MNKCKKCKLEMDSHRVHLGYSECVNCSTTKKYSSHTVYPHKTGGYIQPVSSEKSDELKRLDRRGISSNKVAKGIFSDNSWDRWLESYNNKPIEKKNKITVTTIPKLFIPYEKAINTVMRQYNSDGYNSACELTQSLYTTDKISLMHKSQIMNELAGLQMLTIKQRKWMKKL